MGAPTELEMAPQHARRVVGRAAPPRREAVARCWFALALVIEAPLSFALAPNTVQDLSGAVGTGFYG